MRKLFSLALASVLAAAFLFADAVTTFGQAAVANPASPSPTTVPEIMPPNPPDQRPVASPPAQLPSMEQLDEMFKQTPLGKAADEARLHAQWRDLRNRTVNEPDLVAARAQAEAARTDLEKRQRLRVYYESWSDRMKLRADSQELKDYIASRKAEQIGSLAQDRVRPGSSPPATPVAQASPKKKHKKHPAALEPALPQ